MIRKSGSEDGRYAHIRVQARREAIATRERIQKSGSFWLEGVGGHKIGRKRRIQWMNRQVMKTLTS